MILAGLGDNSLARHLTPLLELDQVENIFIVRSRRGVEHQKICYIKISAGSRLAAVFKKSVAALKCAKNNKVDYIHSFYLIPHGLIALVVGKIRRRKTGVSLIGTDLNFHIKKRFYGFFLIRLLRLFDVVTVTGTKSREYLRSRGLRPCILPHCVDENEFKPAEKEKKLDLLYVGRLSSEKRIDRIIEVASALKERGDIRVGLIGLGPQEKRLKRMVEKGKMQTEVLFFGYQANVVPYYQTASLLILMSESEGLPLALIEGMACGVVPVVLNIGDIGDIVSQDNGLIFNTYNPRRIGEAIISLLEDQRLFLRLRDNSLRISNTRNLKTGRHFWHNLLNGLEIT